MKNWLYITLASLTLVSSPIITEGFFFEKFDESCCAPCCLDGLTFASTSYLDVGGAVGRGYGDDPGHGTFGAFLSAPLGQNWLPFVDVQAHVLGNGFWAVNAGLGLRWLNPCSNRIFGANIFYDYRQMRHSHHRHHDHNDFNDGFRHCHSRHNEFNQVGFGLEWLGPCWDLRLNGYFPVGNDSIRSKPHVYDDYVGNYVMVCRTFQYAMKGFDLQLGYHLFCFCGLDFYSAIGTYYFAQHRKHAWGYLGRLMVTYGDFLSIEWRSTYDNLFHSKNQAVFNLMIPFDVFANVCGCWNGRNHCAYLISQPVQRNDLIIVTDPECCWEWNF